MEFDKLSDAELDARFQHVYDAAHPPRVIDAYKPSFRQRWAEAKWSHKLAALFIVGFFLPMTIIIGGILALVAWDALTGR